MLQTLECKPGEGFADLPAVKPERPKSSQAFARSPAKQVGP